MVWAISIILVLIDCYNVSDVSASLYFALMFEFESAIMIVDVGIIVVQK